MSKQEPVQQPEPVRQIDQLLRSFLQAVDEAEDEALLARIIEHITPTIKKIVSRSRHPDDACQETIRQVLKSLRDFKADPDNKTIHNLPHYVAVVASHVRIISWCKEQWQNLDEIQLSELPPAPGPRQDKEVEGQQLIERYLKRLWKGIEELTWRQRIAYLLNFRVADYGVELFRDYGIATMRQIGALLQLSDEHFARLWPELGEEAICYAERLRSYDEKFALLSKHLPLNDNLIAKMLGTERQNVITHRHNARENLSQNLDPGEKVV